MERGNVIKVTVIVVLFVTAAAFSARFFLSGPAAPIVPDDVTMVDLVCVDSGEHIQLPFDVIAKHGLAHQGRGRRPSAEPEPVKVDVFPAPECGESGAVLARYCTQCDRYYPKELPDGTKGVCPQCGM